MGACCATDADNAAIGTYMRQEKQDNKAIKKLLFLGAGSSGKSTIFKQFARIQEGDEAVFDESTIDETAKVIQSNLIMGILTLLKQTQLLYAEDPAKYSACHLSLEIGADKVIVIDDDDEEDDSGGIGAASVSHGKERVTTKEFAHRKKLCEMIEFIINHQSLPNDEITSENALQKTEEMKTMNDHIHYLWGLPAIKTTFKYRLNKFSLPENLDHFFNLLKNIDESDEKRTGNMDGGGGSTYLFDSLYVPDAQSMLLARQRTSGILSRSFEMKDHRFQIYDVGGQRNERKKWIHSFTGVDALLYVSALNHVWTVLFEDENINSMHESLRLFSEITNSKWFSFTEIILFLNKLDIFTEWMFNGNSLKSCFGVDSVEWNGGKSIIVDLNTNDDEKGGKGVIRKDVDREIYPKKDGLIWNGPDFRPNLHGLSDDEKRSMNDGTYTYTDDFEKALGDGISFLKRAHKGLNINPSRQIFIHVTTATDMDNVKKVFWSIQNIAIRSGLSEGGVLGGHKGPNGTGGGGTGGGGLL